MYCPECGRMMMFIGRTDDVPTTHDTYKCSKHGKWVFTYSKGIHGELLHIAKGGE